MNEITLPCSNCKALIEESKHALHEMYCERNNIKCPKCGRFYDKNDPEGHEDEYHRKEKCPHCQREFDDLSKHVCSMKPKQCLYCDLTFPSQQLFQHENQCGSRTEKCDRCGQYIMKREIMQHNCEPPKKQEIQKKPANQEIYDKPKQFDDNYEQQQYANKKEASLAKPQGNGQKYSQAYNERPVVQTVKYHEKIPDPKPVTRPSSNQQNRTQQPKTNNAVQKNEKTQFDNKFDKDQYQSKQKQPPTLESIKPQVKPATMQPRQEQLKRPDTAIAREYQKQLELEEMGLTPEEYMHQQMMMEEMEKKAKSETQQKPQQQQPMQRQPQKTYEPPQKAYEPPQKTYEPPPKQFNPPSKQFNPPPQNPPKYNPNIPPSRATKAEAPIAFEEGRNDYEDEFSYMTQEEIEFQRQLIESMNQQKKKK